MYAVVYFCIVTILSPSHIPPQATYSERHWEPHQSRAMAEAVGAVAEFESKNDLTKLVSDICTEACTLGSF